MSDAPSPPAFGRIVVELSKLRDYCLSLSHPRGRHKARVFRARLGLQADDAVLLQAALHNAARDHPETLYFRRTDHHGRHYMLVFEMSTDVGTGIIRSFWIAPAGSEDVLRFVTCYLE